MFKEALESHECVAILCNCMKNLIVKLNELFHITLYSQIKSELQLKSLNETVNFICTKSGEYEKERKEREQILKNLEENVSVMTEKVENMDKEIYKREWYFRRNCILIHGIVEADV